MKRILIGLALFTVLIGCSEDVKNINDRKRDYYTEITDQDLKKSVPSFDIGIYLNKIYDFDLNSKTFAADGYAWLKWRGAIDAWDKETSSAPAKTIEFVNAVNHSQLRLQLSPEVPYLDSEGWSYQAIVFSGRFLADDLKLQRFPFEKIKLPIEIETDDFWITDAILTNDTSGSSGIADRNTLHGYTYTGFKTLVRKHVYPTSMGLNADAQTTFGDPNTAVYPNFTAEFEYERINLSSIWQLFVPLIAVIGIAIMTPLINPHFAPPKIAVPASVVLALVFLQNGYREMLPQSLSYLTYMDKVYCVAYVIASIVFFEAIWSTNTVRRGSSLAQEDKVMRVQYWEKRINILLLLAAAVIPLLLW